MFLTDLDLTVLIYFLLNLFLLYWIRCDCADVFLTEFVLIVLLCFLLILFLLYWNIYYWTCSCCTDFVVIVLLCFSLISFLLSWYISFLTCSYCADFDLIVLLCFLPNSFALYCYIFDCTRACWSYCTDILLIGLVLTILEYAVVFLTEFVLIVLLCFLLHSFLLCWCISYRTRSYCIDFVAIVLLFFLPDSLVLYGIRSDFAVMFLTYLVLFMSSRYAEAKFPPFLSISVDRQNAPPFLPTLLFFMHFGADAFHPFFTWQAYFSFLMQQNKCQKPPQSSGALAAAAATFGACFLVGPVAGGVCARGWKREKRESDERGRGMILNLTTVKCFLSSWLRANSNYRQQHSRGCRWMVR
jgi:hypothetical protein